jgi:hypothetical protein
LGATADGETNGQPSAAADQATDDDGVFPISSLVAMPNTTTTASFRLVASPPAKLDAWIDFNQNGTFDQPAEHLGGGASIDLTAGDNIVTFGVPVAARTGATSGRFRISSAGGLGPKGSAPDGEVEDYSLTVVDGSRAPAASLDLPAGRFE